MEHIKNNKKEFQAPEFLDAPYLTEEYIKENGWYPVPEKWFEGEQPSSLHNSPFFELDEEERIYIKTEFGEILCRGRNEFKVGDIMIMRDYKGPDITEKFIRLEQEHIDNFAKEKEDMLLDAIVVPEPENS